LWDWDAAIFKPAIIAHLSNNRSDRIRIALDYRQGPNPIDTRVTSPLIGASDTWCKAAASVVVEIAQLLALPRALQNAEVTARKLGMLGGAA
jgi:hypothetical protein